MGYQNIPLGMLRSVEWFFAERGCFKS